jgi:hypothetical protein
MHNFLDKLQGITALGKIAKPVFATSKTGIYPTNSLPEMNVHHTKVL